MNFAGYRKHLESKDAPAPLTTEEFEQQLVLEAEAEVCTHSGLSFSSSWFLLFSAHELFSRILHVAHLHGLWAAVVPHWLVIN